jgi:hypothetical protein
VNPDIRVAVDLIFERGDESEVFRRVKAIRFGSDTEFSFGFFESDKELLERVGVADGSFPDADVLSQINRFSGDTYNWVGLLF